ncbi:alpha/beta hydrolase family protein [Roseateles saccharophilus]|uniref:Dipeptidyl aminopeptidase/acylaminoacyl peptidase n=1 Tax=Roseateles saccharophilus TaxID=304 RepID=A0A4R3UI17_ROSSA|nr:prolyl oligopeptidase family serine peptidase [Roseateles saccharophilus]MDG0834583.1 S9 family peptidase [Roseateles saccharophilus]TCU89058.1 dipeptidyl aminopeptidase/acylaminoacyl peptidase [Roseateles saccharophilus]
MIQSLRAAFVAMLLCAVTVQAAPPPTAAFFKPPDISAPKLSPNGRYLAVLVAGKNERMWLAVIDLQNPGAPKAVAGFFDADISSYHWVNDERLVYDASNTRDGSSRVRAPGLWAVDRDGSKQRQLIHATWDSDSTSTRITDRRLELNWQFAGTLDSGGDEVFVVRLPWDNEAETQSLQFSRLDTRTGLRRSLSYQLPDGVRQWHLDALGEPRAVESVLQGRHKTYLREGDGWRLWQDQPAYGDDRSLKPKWFGPDGQVLVLDGYQGYSAIYKLDPTTLKREDKPLLNFKGYDFRGSIEYDPQARRLLGIHYETDAPGTVWLDATMKAHQAAIDAKLPGSVNRISCGRCLSSQALLVTAYSDQRPPVYWLYKPADKQLQPLAAQRPDIKPADMGQRDYHRIKTRDGLEIPVLVTQPAGGNPVKRPTVVLVHGGPYLRGTHWTWEPEAQFLASRGYLVLEPEFRGSAGYGWQLFRAGWKQWGLGMQDDLADTLAWAVKQGWADPQRACIAGASYGGYAALMGAIQQADLFKCAVDWVGVTDIGLMSSIHWSDISEEWKRYGMSQLVADPATDAAQIRSTSPLQRARDIGIPLLMAYGGSDRRVPIKHGTDLKAAMSPDQPLEWVDYPDEGHGWFNLKTNEDFWGRVERFLARHIGADAKPSAPGS